MKYVLLIAIIFISHNSLACVQFSDKFDNDGFVKQIKVERNAHNYSVYFPSKIKESTASYAYIYLEKNNETIMTTLGKVRIAPELYDLGEELFEDYMVLDITVNEKYKNGVSIHVHYEAPVKDSHTISCGPMRRYKLSELVEKEL